MPRNDEKTPAKGYLAIIEELRKELDGGRYRPGEKLPSEKELCQRFTAGRSMIREALAALTYAGIIEARGGSGYYVIGNPADLITDRAAHCAAKVLAAAEESFTIMTFKRLLTAGADGIILRADNQGQWHKQLRAARQAASDLGMPLPILAQVSPVDADLAGAVNSALSVNSDVIVVGPDTSAQAVLTVRKLIEEQGANAKVFAWISSPDDGPAMVQVADGALVNVPPVVDAAKTIFTSVMYQGIATGKPMFLTIAAGELAAGSEEVASLAENWGFDGFAITSACSPVDRLATDIRLLRINTREIEERTASHGRSRPGKIVASPLANALCSTALHAVTTLKAMALVIPSETGFTPRLISKFRAQVPVLAITPDIRVARQLKLVWGVWPLLTKRTGRHDDALDEAIRTAVNSEYVSDGDIIVGVTSGSDTPNAVNAVTFAVVGDVILRGQGIGSGVVSGRITIIKSLYNAKKSVANKIVVIPATDASHIKFIEQAAALIVEDGGLSSHAAIACLSLGKPVIVGAVDATELLLEDEQVTLDISRGMIYRGWVNLG